MSLQGAYAYLPGIVMQRYYWEKMLVLRSSSGVSLNIHLVMR
jgi:hypothetical protein